MNQIPASMSLSGYAYQHVTDWLNTSSNQTEKIYKQISAECAYTGIMVFGALEALARGVQVLALRGISHLVGESHRRETRNYINGFGQNFICSAGIAGSSALALKDNLVKAFSAQTPGPIIDGNDTVDKMIIGVTQVLKKIGLY